MRCSMRTVLQQHRSRCAYTLCFWLCFVSCVHRTQVCMYAALEWESGEELYIDFTAIYNDGPT